MNGGFTMNRMSQERRNLVGLHWNLMSEERQKLLVLIGCQCSLETTICKTCTCLLQNLIMKGRKQQSGCVSYYTCVSVYMCVCYLCLFFAFCLLVFKHLIPIIELLMFAGALLVLHYSFIKR